MSGDARLRKAQLVRTSLDELARLPQSTADEFTSDFRNVESALHLLQTTIHSLLDMASVACARLGLQTPRTSFEILERLEADGRLPAGAAQRFTPLVGFRNRTVHLYDRIDPLIVFRIVREQRDDLVDLLDLLLGIEQA